MLIPRLLLPNHVVAEHSFPSSGRAAQVFQSPIVRSLCGGGSIGRIREMMVVDCEGVELIVPSQAKSVV